ncbi:MAG: hypothetical protein AAF927_25920 [Bacteroidota bacterium]
MHHHYFLILLPLLWIYFSGSSLGGEKRSTEGENPITISLALKSLDDRDAQIAAIRKEFARLQPLLKSLPKNSYEFEAKGEPYWETTTGWKENGSWVKLQKSASSEHSHEVEDFYLKDGKLFFYYAKLGSYYYFPEYTYTRVNEERLYFAEGKLIHKLVKNVEDRSKEGVDLDRIPNEEIALPPNPKQIYEMYYAELESLIDTLKVHTGAEKE